MNPTFYLFLDDLRAPEYLVQESKTRVFLSTSKNLPLPEKFTTARSVEEAQDMIALLGFPSVLSLDHDLGDGTPSGYDFVKWLIEQDLEKNWMQEDFEFTVHSMNPIGSRNMFEALWKYYLGKF